MNIKELDKNVKEFIERYGKNACINVELGTLAKAFYLGMKISDPYAEGDWDEIASELELSSREIKYWEDLYYNKNSWLYT